MSGQEPLSAAQLMEIQERAETLAVAWGQRKPDLRSGPETAADFGARIAREDVPALLAEVARLRVRLAQYEGANWAEIPAPEDGAR